MKILLVDNGSLAPAAIRRLRAIAAALGGRIGQVVTPVSLAHADRVPAEQTDGVPAGLMEPVLRREAAAGEREFVILPLFVGPGRAVTEVLPSRAEKLREEFPGLRVRIAPPLHQPKDDRLARMLATRVRAALTPEFTRGEPVRVAVVDHGSPTRAVAAARDEVAGQLAALLGAEVAAVAPGSMERRPGPEYDFNEPLLETLLTQGPWREGPVVVAPLFLLPGRHAGAGGDLAAIGARAMREHPALRLAWTEPLGSHPGLIDVLAGRFTSVQRQAGRLAAGA